MFSNILFTEEDILKIKNTQDTALKEYVAKALEDAENMLNFENDKFYTFGGKCEQIQLMGFAYNYTKNEKYAEKAKEMMRHKVEEELWISDEYDPNKYNGYDIRTALETGDRCNDMAFLLALFGEALTEDEKKKYAMATYEKGIVPILEDWVRPNHKIHALDTMGHNFWITTISNSALAAVTLKDYIPDANKCLEDAIKALKAWFEYKGNPLNAKPQNVDNGGNYESAGYADYSSKEYLQFAAAYKNVMGKKPFDDTEAVLGMANFQVNIAYMSDTIDYSVGFGDCGNSFRNTPIRLVHYGLSTPEIRWYIKTCLNQSDEKIIRILSWDDIYNKEAKAPEQLSVCYDKIGWATFRDSHERNSTMLAIKCGDTWNHAHADCANFLLYRKGRPEIYESVTYGGYSNKLYQGYYVTSQAHNVLLFNDKGQDFRDNYKNHTHLPGRLLNYIDDNGFRYVVADGTGPMSRYFRKHHRHFLWLNGFILVYDDVECYDCGKVSFLLHAEEDSCFKMLSPCTVTKHNCYSDTVDKPNDQYTSFNVHTDDEGHAKFVGIMVLDESLSPVYEEIEDGCRITCGKTTVYINFRSDGKIMHRNCINIMDGIATDCMILVNDGEKYGIVNGSIIRKDGISYLDTLTRVTGWADRFN